MIYLNCYYDQIIITEYWKEKYNNLLILFNNIINNIY